MKLWLLTRNDGIGWDEYDSFVVRAPTETQARALANSKCGDEGHVWSLPKTTCEVLRVEGSPEVILGSFRSG